MPREVYGRDFAFLPRAELLTFEEITRLARIFVSLGVRKVRLTGGEPLLRRDLPALVRMLSGMNDVGFPVTAVLAGIDAAEAAGLSPIKVNMVVRRGLNEASVVPMARYFRERGHVLRFIEYMDVGHTNGWRMDDVVPATEILGMIDAVMPLRPLPATYPGEVADRWAYSDGGGEVGVIASVTQPFCADCTRARLTADGQLYTCLFASAGRDLRAPLRTGASDADITDLITAVWRTRDDRYSELRSLATVQYGRELPVFDPNRVEMSRIGG
jgi:cyclic pyranopterin phosphate synthase